MIDFIKAGKSNYTILCGNNACEMFAAKELKKFVEQATGVVLEMCETESDRPFISVGNTNVFVKSGLKPIWQKKTQDGIYISEKDGNIYLIGKRVRSTLYAVYDFLETFFNIRFLAPDCTIVPKCENIQIGEISKTEEPSFDIRSFYNVQMEKDALYTARLRQVALYCEEREELGYGLKKEGMLSPHNVLKYLPVDKYYESHPEYFYLDVMDLSKKHSWDLCWSQGIDEEGNAVENGSAYIVAKNIIEDIKDNPDYIWFSLTQNDMPKGCHCEKCKQNIKKYGGYSGIIIRYMNAVATIIENWRKNYAPEREIRLVTFAYAYSLQPPIDEFGNVLIRPKKNIWIWLATGEQNMFYACNENGQHQDYTKNIEGWKKVTNRFCYWDYRFNVVEHLFYYPGLSTYEQDFKFLESLGVSYLFCQAASGDINYPDIVLTLLQGYVAAKLMWNTSLSSKTLVREFCDGYFGVAADKVVEVIDLFEENYQRIKKEIPTARSNLGLGYRMLEGDYYPPEMLRSAIEILQDAIEHSEDDILKKRLLNFLCVPQRMLLRNYLQYYPNDIKGKDKIYKVFLENCEQANLTVLGVMDFTLENLRKYPDYNWWKMNNIPY